MWVDFRHEIDGQSRLYHTTFVVKKPPDRPKASILVLAATNTWLAYNSKPFPITPVELLQRWGTAGIDNSPGNPPAYSCYLNHRPGQPTIRWASTPRGLVPVPTCSTVPRALATATSCVPNAFFTYGWSSKGTTMT